MRAINLVPADSRQSTLSAGKSGGAAFAVLGVMFVLFLGLVGLAMAHHKEATANAQLATIQQNTQTYSQAATQYSSFETAASQATERIDTVKSLASARFDWAGALRDLSRLIPRTARIETLAASVSADNASGGTQLRSAIQSPAITMTGCTTTQNAAANMVTQFQAMRRVTNVTLEYSKLVDSHWQNIHDGTCQDYAFAIDIFFTQGSAQPAADAVSTSGGSTTQTVGNTATTTNATATTPTTPATTPPSGN